VYDAVSAQFDPPLGKVLRPFRRMRRQRRDAESPQPTHSNHTDDVREDLKKVTAIVNMLTGEFAGRSRTQQLELCGQISRHRSPVSETHGSAVA
jgi:hypothetical protein